MDATEWGTLAAALAAWAGIAVGQVHWSKSLRRAENQEMERRRLEEVERVRGELKSQMEAFATRMTKEHEAVSVQIRDMSRTAAENFVSHREYALGFRTINESLAEGRRELSAIGEAIARVGERVDGLYRDVEFRKGRS